MINKRELVKKWSEVKGKIGISDIKDPYIRENVAVLLENQETQDIFGSDVRSLLTESSFATSNTTTIGGTTDGTAATDAYIFKPISLALVRRTFPDLFANKVCGVQAMNTPVGLAYALRCVYADGSGNEAAWDNVDWYAGYSGSQYGTSGLPRGISAAYDVRYNTAGNSGRFDTSATGADTSAAESWTLSGGGMWPLTATSTSTSGTTTTVLSPATGFGYYPQLRVRIDQLSVTAKERKLATTYSLEAAQDLRTMHGLDIEREMLNFLQYEVTAEMDRELLAALKTAAVDATNGGESVSAIDLTGSGTGVDGRWSGEKYMNIVATILYFANKIAIKTRRGAGNFCVVSPVIATALQAAGHPFVNLNANVNATNVMASIGSIQKAVDIYRDQYARSEYALVGFKGPGVSDAGVIFCPYIMGVTNRAIKAETFEPSIGVLSRYAVVNNLLGAGRYYRLVPFYNVDKMIAGYSAASA